ncbi:MATE family efflux transporter [Bacillus sp. DNRA2]|uniref:MATE family efflux transporter n=1 Tax=Bacillus sp. DNRA2 TaxID=2723053 RepID=UPI00145F9DF6|nr:MATE family efflux transporter [Bacillus sp. DNRA2]NMD69994.1 MATE family efflux transporter [Bacillus sp. DNRA2]
MIKTNNTFEKIKQLLIILLPILVTQLGLFMMNFFDTTMSGHYSSIDLAGVAIGSSIWVSVFTGLSGIMLAVTPIIAQLVGGNKHDKVAFSVIQGTYLSVLLALVVIGLGALFLTPLLHAMNLETNVYTVARDYLIALGYGMIPLFIFTVLRAFIDALGKTRVSMIITLISLPINVLLNYLFIFGKLGFPALGGVGAGYATSITYWIILILTIIIIQSQRPFTNYHIFKRLYPIALVTWKEILLIGIPIGLSMFFETSIFSAVTLLMSQFDTATIASHQAAINFASLLYMIPLSISMALTIVIGFEVGAKRLQDAKQYSFLGVTIAIGMACFSGLILLFFRSEISALYSADPLVQKLTTQFLMYAFFFQLSDAIQAPIQGALRGYKDVNITFWMALVSYWVIGLPLGYFLVKYTDLGPFGYWIGLIIGLATGAVCLSIRLFHLQSHQTFQFKKEHS